MTTRPEYRCPYEDCTFEGTDDEVDEHRTYAHRDEPQAGSNLRNGT
jgi:hypothetical protein